MHGKTLRFGAVEREPDIRPLDAIRSFLMDREYARTANNRPLYYMYRDLYRAKDEEAIRANNLRFDVTVMPANHLGQEYVKTKGHYHPDAGHGVPYPELYEVMSGRAHYLLQKKGTDGIEDVIVVKAKRGDTVIIPPGYGHITINPGTTTLKMANWVSSSFDSRYEDIEQKQGGAYYETITGEWVKNTNYDTVPDVRFAEPRPVPELKMTGDRPMYELIRAPDNLAFLNRPHKYTWLFENLY